jgi:hypothetical protein
MAKRRTKKQKQEAKHTFTYSWKPNLNEAKNTQPEANVKGQLTAYIKPEKESNMRENSAYKSEYNSNLASTKKQIYRSLLLAGFILASEVVLYLALK